jgi:hypothetical protein
MFLVIPPRIGARDDDQAGIQYIEEVTNFMDSSFHRSDDFLRDHQALVDFLRYDW